MGYWYNQQRINVLKFYLSWVRYLFIEEKLER